MADVVVVGSGAVGLMTAYRLQKAGLVVTLLGGDRPGQASSVAGAMLGTFGEVVSTTLGTEHGRARFELDLKASRAWSSVLEEIADQSGRLPDRHILANQTLMIHNTAGAARVDDDNFAAVVSALREFGGRFTEEDPGRFQLSPHQPLRPLRALMIHGELAINPMTWMEDLHASFVKAGGTFVEKRALRLFVQGGKTVGVVDDREVVWWADRTILCAGAFTQQILENTPEVGPTMPIFSGAGVSVEVDEAPQLIPSTVIRTPNRAFACGLHAVPRGDGRWYLGATNHIVAKPVTKPLLEDVTFLLNCAVEQLHSGFAASRLSSLSTGNRPVAVDGFPLVGHLGLKGLLIASGTYREGVHLSPVIGDYLLDLIMERKTEAEWEVFNPLRLPYSGKRAEVIEQTVQHALATGDEFGWRIPAVLRGDLEQTYRAHFNSVLERLDCEFVPPPEILTVLHRIPSLFVQLRRYYRRLANG